MRFIDFVLYASLVLFILYITKVNNMWGVGKATKKARDDARAERVRQKKRLRFIKFMSICEWLGSNVGLTVSLYKQQDYQHKIDRLGWKVPYLGRAISPLELVGFMRLVMLIFSFCGLILGVLVSQIFLILCLSIFLPAVFSNYADGVIAKEDAELEEDFPDFFLIIYSRLIKGSKTRLAPTLRDYAQSLDGVSGGTSDSVIRNFVTDLRNNIEIYGDDGIAITKLRDKYRSVLVINFCNLAIQAINGVDNSDKLLAFKVELNHRRTEKLKEKADKLVSKGSKAVYLIYLILFQFIALSWIAKLSGTGGLGGILGW